MLDAEKLADMTTAVKMYAACSSLVATDNLELENFPGPMPDLDVIRCGPRHGTFGNSVDLINDVAYLEIRTGEPGNRTNLHDARRERVRAQIKILLFGERKGLRDSVVQARNLIGQASSTPAARIRLAWVEFGALEEIEELRTARNVEDQMGTNGIAIGDSVLRLIIKCPGLAHGEMFRASFGEKVCLIVRDDRYVNAKWLEPRLFVVSMRAGYTQRFHAEDEGVICASERTEFPDQPADIGQVAQNRMVDLVGSVEVLLCSLVTTTKQDHVRTAMCIPVGTGPRVWWYGLIVFYQATDIDVHREAEKRALPEASICRRIH